MRHAIFVLLTLLFFSSCTGFTSGAGDGYDYDLFKNTPVWDLAKAVKNNNAEKIKQLVKSEGFNVNFKESKFGQTLLLLAVGNQQYVASRALLEAGADPNLHNDSSGKTPLIEAADMDMEDKEVVLSLIKLLLEFGADPSKEEFGKRQEGNTVRNTPLLAACWDIKLHELTMEKVKLLVGAGADVNYQNEFGQFPLKSAIIYRHYDVALFLMMNGADFKRVMIDDTDYNPAARVFYIADLMRLDMFPLDSKEYQQKMQVVKFLKEKGIDYRKAPIPESIVEEVKETYPQSWKEYLDKYQHPGQDNVGCVPFITFQEQKASHCKCVKHTDS